MKIKPKVFLSLTLISVCLLCVCCKEEQSIQSDPDTHLSVILKHYGKEYEVYNEADDENLEFKTHFEESVKKAKKLSSDYHPKEDLKYGVFDIYVKKDNATIAKYYAHSPLYTSEGMHINLKYNFQKDFYNYLGHVHLKGYDLDSDEFSGFVLPDSIEDFCTFYGYATIAEIVNGSVFVDDIINDIMNSEPESGMDTFDLYYRLGVRLSYSDYYYKRPDFSRFIDIKKISDFYACYGYVKFLKYTK